MKTFTAYLEEASSFKYYYHVTFKNKSKKIASQGLKPLQTSNWVKGTGKRYNDEYAGVYAFEHPEDAWRWAFKMDWDFKQPVSIIRLKKSGKWEKDPSEDITLQMGKGNAIMSKGAIPASKVVDVIDFEEFSNPQALGISRDVWMKGIVKRLST